MTDTREELIRQLLARRGLTTAVRADIPRRPPGTAAPLSPMQEGLWFLDRLRPGDPSYTLSQVVRLTGPLDTDALRASAAALMARHEALRTRIRADDGVPVQEVLPPGHAELADPVTVASGALEEVAFDLGQAPLLRIRLSPGDHLLAVALHHIIADETSVGIVLAELLDGLLAVPVEPPAVQFPDYVLWQRDRITAAGDARLRRFWDERLAGMPEFLDLTTSPAVSDTHGATLPFTVPAEVTAAIDGLAARTGCTRFMILLAALQVVLARLSGQDDICVGSPVSLRTDDRLHGTVGLFVNSLPLRTDLSGDPTLDAVLRRVRETCVASLDHAALPFDRIVELAAPARDAGRNPLFQVMLVLNRAETPRERSGLGVHPVPVRRDTARLDVTVAVHESADGLSGVLDHRTAVLDATAAARLVERLLLTLRALASAGATRLSALDLLTDDEKRDLAAWNDTGPARGGDTTLHELIDFSDPEAIAVLDDGKPLTYGELDRRSADLAGRLTAAGVRHDEPVGMTLPAGADAVVAIVGILRAGAAYLPVDPAVPPARRAELLRGVTTVDGVSSDGTPPADHHPDQLAYVIHTSGSTGTPKGVMVTHRTAVNLARAFVDRHGIGPGDRLLMLPPLSFDASAGDLFPALISGATLVTHRDPGSLTGPGLLDFCRTHGVTIVDTAAPLWLSWVDQLTTVDPGPLRMVMAGGEPVPVAAVRRWAELTGGTVPVVNHYGPTEATICATTYATTDDADLSGASHLPIGRPVDGVRVHLLDPALRPVPPGQPGEVYVGGCAPARGYRDSPGATAARFLPDPFEGRGARMYRTGDLARHRPDGTLEFLGRTDRQVKIRGFRIEPGEVEAVCATLPGVRRAAVIAADHPAGRHLVGYLVPDHSPLDLAAARAALRDRLPDHLVPAALVEVPDLPLTRHGKLDVAALPDPPDAPDRPAHVPPRTRAERALAAIWAELLGSGPVGVHDNFFDLGGHSLLAARIAARAEQALGTPVPLALLFSTADLAALAAAVDAGESAVPGPDRLRADARLDLPPLPPPTPRDVTDVLVTGATGFLGAHLLADWLTHHPATLHCLVRAGDPAAALDRVRANLIRYGLWQPSYAERLIGVPGDLAAPGLGLSPGRFAELGDRVQAVLHNGGVVNFLQPYAALVPPNVDGTREVLRLAATGMASAVHFVSTLGVFLTPARRGGLVREGDAPDDCDGLGDGYNATKWVADALVRAGRDQGLPVSVHRPARVTGHSVTGDGNTDDYFTRLLTTFVQLGAVPDLDDEIDMAPVDYVAAGIGRLTRTGSAADHHYYNNRTMSFPALAASLTAYGYPARVLPYARWRALLLDRPDAALTPFAPLFGEHAPVRTQPAFDCTATETALRTAGITCPAADERLLHTTLAALVRAGVLDPPGSSHG